MTDIEIRYDGSDITAFCVIAETRFTCRSGGSVGDATVTVSDIDQSKFFTAGKTLELYIDGQREWDGYVISKNFQYWFYGHTANCRPCDHLTPRRIVLNGADRNVLFTRRVLFDDVDPTRTDRIYPAGTMDSDIIADFVADYLHPHDAIDYSTKVETVASPDPWAEIDLPGPSNLWGDFMRELSQATGAVFYIDPDRYLVYTDVNTVSAPFGISDRPQSGEIGCREVSILQRADEMVNDAMVWGVGQGVDHVAFARIQDSASIAAHGRWQNTGGFHYNLYKQGSVDRVANSIIYGSPSNKRGHKDNAVSVACTIFEPGIRVSDKVDFRSAIHGFEDVIPVRQMDITFPAGPDNVRYDLRLSHEIDEPWITNEYWWPRLQEPGNPGGNCPTLTCSVPIFTEGSTTTIAPPAADSLIRPSHRSAFNDIDWFVKIAGGVNIWYWYTNPTGEFHSLITSTTLDCEYTASYLDEIRYSGIPGLSYTPREIVSAGPREWAWWTDYGKYRTPLNTLYPGLGIRCHFHATVTFLSRIQPRLRLDNAASGSSNPLPHIVQILLLHPGGALAEDGLTAYEPVRVVAPPLLEGTMVDGQSQAIDVFFNMDELESFYIAPQIFEANFTAAIGWGRLRLSGMTMTFTPLKPAGYIGIPGCQEIPICGNACVVAELDHGLVYRVPVSYIPGSLQVTMNGLSMRWGSDFIETDPAAGEFELSSSLDRSVYTDEPYACFDGAGLSNSNLPNPDGTLFIVPIVSTRISATFGAQTALWPPAVWHGTYYEHFHNGVDFGVGEGTPVYAAADGLTAYETQDAGGVMIHIYHSNGMRTTYAHLSQRVIAENINVSQGDLIAYSGATGEVTGAHLHWGMVWAGEPEDPLPYSNYSKLVP